MTDIDQICNADPGPPPTHSSVMTHPVFEIITDRSGTNHFMDSIVIGTTARHHDSGLSRGTWILYQMCQGCDEQDQFLADNMIYVMSSGMKMGRRG